MPLEAPPFVQHVTAMMMAGRGDELPVSAMPADGTYPSGTTQWEKRNISDTVPAWQPDICIQCGNCAMVCPHAAIRARYYDESALATSPEGFAHAPLAGRGFPNLRFTLQVSVEDCTGCELCVEACPARSLESAGVRAINMEARVSLLERERRNLAFFNELPDNKPAGLDASLVRGVQYLTPLFEYSGACGGCGETPYLRLLTQLFGDRLLVANATGCSSIYGGNLPTTPWTTNREGRGPAWANSLFEDNAEFGLGYRLTLDKHHEHATELLKALAATAWHRSRHRDPRRAADHAGRRRRAAAPGGGAARRAGATGRPPGRSPADPVRLPRAEERLDRGGRRVGVRHRLWRPRSRPRVRPQGSRPGARHRGLFEHGRPGLEIHPAGSRREVRRGRQARPQEGSRPDGDRLRQRLRRADRDGCLAAADGRRLPRGRGP